MTLAGFVYFICSSECHNMKKKHTVKTLVLSVMCKWILQVAAGKSAIREKKSFPLSARHCKQGPERLWSLRC